MKLFYYILLIQGTFETLFRLLLFVFLQFEIKEKGTVMDDIPEKRPKLADNIDFRKCIICQASTKESLVGRTSTDSFGKILQFLQERSKYGELELQPAWNRLANMTPELLLHNNASFHMTCRKSIVCSQKLQRAKARYDQAIQGKNVNILSRGAGRP